jgi:hypothetical protein
MTNPYNSNDEAYIRIVESIDWADPKTFTQYSEQLRQLAEKNHIESMTLLAVLLGDIDSNKYREEIIILNERAFKLGSSVAADNLSIQYAQWNEPFLSKLWHSRSKE